MAKQKIVAKTAPVTESNVSKPEQKSDRKAAAWSFTAAFTVLGLGFGFLVGQPLALCLIGVGIGLLITMILRYRTAQ